jgi:hypothetical protein
MDESTPGWMHPDPEAGNRATVDLRTDRPHSARVYDYIIGGKDNFAPDREAAKALLETLPTMAISMRQSRAWMRRVTRWLAAEAGLDQFLDLGTGLPTSPNVHEIVQGVRPDARVVYVDSDPIVLVHARALLTGTPIGRTEYLDADVREPDRVLDLAGATLDFSRPIGLLMVAMLQTIPDSDDPYGLVSRLVDALPSGSYLALSTVAKESNPANEDAVEEYKRRGMHNKARTKPEVEKFFTGLELVDPGVVLVHRWHPDAETAGVEDYQVGMYGGVGFKP